MTHSLEYQNHSIKFYIEGEGEPIVFLHGWPTNARLWQEQVAALQSNYKVITLDWLGFGYSAKPRDFDYTFFAMKEVLDSVLSSALQKQEKVTIVAHDIGGPPSILWASENEERVKRLILLNTVIYPFKTQLDAISEIILDLPFLKNLFVSQFGLKMVMQTNTKSGSKAINQRIERILGVDKNIPMQVKRNSLVGPLREGRRNEIHSIAQKFRDLQAEKHFIIARKDPLCFAHIMKLSEENPEVPAHYLENCGHFIPIDRPEELTQILQGIL